jgi:hypothetical protein
MAKKSKQKSPESLFQNWWQKTASKKVTKIEKAWIKKNKPNEDDEPGGDYWHVNQMMHDGEAYNMTYDIAEKSFLQGYNNEEHDSDSLYCELDEVINLAYQAGKNES